MDKCDTKPNAMYGEIRKTGDEPLEWELNRGPGYWEYRKKWEEYPKKQIVPEGPLHLDIETTNLCNLKCRMCPRTVSVNKGEFQTGVIEFEFYSYLIDQGADFNACSVKFNYLGEPLVHPDVVKQVAYAKRKGFVEVMFNTNAVLLNSEMSRKLLDVGLDSIFFSVDSPYPEKYNEIRKGSDFHRIVRNIENFMRIKEEGGYKSVQTRASMVLMDQDEQELEDYKKVFLDLVGIIGYGEYIDRKRDYGTELGTMDGFVCAQPFQRMFINWDGTVFPCCVDDKSLMNMGNAHETSLIDIWHNKKYNNLRDHMKSGTYFELALCKRCYVPHSKIG